MNINNIIDGLLLDGNLQMSESSSMCLFNLISFEIFKNRIKTYDSYLCRCYKDIHFLHVYVLFLSRNFQLYFKQNQILTILNGSSQNSLYTHLDIVFRTYSHQVSIVFLKKYPDIWDSPTGIKITENLNTKEPTLYQPTL